MLFHSIKQASHTYSMPKDPPFYLGVREDNQSNFIYRHSAWIPSVRVFLNDIFHLYDLISVTICPNYHLLEFCSALLGSFSDHHALRCCLPHTTVAIAFWPQWILYP